MQLFYSDSLTTKSTSYTLPKDESKHVIRVLRKSEGDIIHLTNGNGFLFEAIVEDTNPNKCKLTLISHTYQQPRDYSLHLAVAPTKLHDRFEWFLEKATEIGISEITPILCDHSERKVIKEDRYRKILQSAMKQSLHYHLPVLNSLTSFRTFVDGLNSKNSLIAHCEETEKKSIKDFIKPHTSYTILIGPEGDFSIDEISYTLQKGIQPITLGNTRLRTETAAIAACQSVAFVNY
ncbi:16S rRNA (uracil(1498)-N(3))-methyltransferase [Dokdonia sp. Hel_I_53]|uniref:16S rRNA (uracil(1498)-N(3))-methyltransferase n=1 Tax=Dokdonia sp. Hel_I_53 TaxID=1566287 RepID=UPI001198FBED|nr:16S rRNA (uracil(1498)-N(3))-methyltransferase [Dokdonia sp. Hel_I_53]TVZ51156.1 16S rRNA (uracil1498-N3)-methyltransferase [Dokdonia sp. Hel_I_53]